MKLIACLFPVGFVEFPKYHSLGQDAHSHPCKTIYLFIDGKYGIKFFCSAVHRVQY